MEIDQDLTSSVAAVEDIPGKESVKVSKNIAIIIIIISLLFIFFQD